MTVTGEVDVTIGAGAASAEGGATIVVNSDGMTIMAKGGQRANKYTGGSGWSGGGGYYKAGGYNGGDGQSNTCAGNTNCSGGSGQKIALPTIQGVNIIPGTGGKAGYGGGGGGIIINGEGTKDDDNKAQGYGAGSDWYSTGMSGAVILYV